MLRTRIILSQLPFIAVLLGVSAFALFLFTRLANQVDQTIAENYLRDAAAVEMMLCVERMDSALSRARKEERSSMQLMFDTNSRLFAKRLQAQLTNTAYLAPWPDLPVLQTNFNALLRLSLDMFSTNLTAEAEDLKYNESIILTDNLKRTLSGLREEVRKNIFATGASIKHTSRTFTTLLVLGLIAALSLSIFVSMKLGQAILKPIQTLTNAAREIGQGHLAQTVPVLAGDELGELATTFNNMAAQLNTYRQSTTEQIIRLHRTMEAALASFSDPVFIMDRYGRIELSNRAAEELSTQLLLDGALPPKLLATASDVLQRNQDFLPDSFDEVLLLRANGTERSFLPRLHIMREADQRPIGVAVVLHDVTRFRLLDDAKTNLVATVSHELKTPLTSVRMVLHLILEQSLGPLTEQQASLLETARKDAERLLKMLDALLDIARLEAGASALTKSPLAPMALVEAIRDETVAHVTASGLKLVTTVAASLPAVLVDRQQIGQVFHNFIANAIKHSPPGGKIQIAATAGPDGSVQFSVSDEGPGIAPEHQGLIFDRFFRVPGQAKHGAGLGLSIAREIVVAHGGRVGVRSEPGRGSEFFFILEGYSETVEENGRGGEI